MELNKPQARWKENQIRNKIQRWLSGQFLEELIRYQLESRDGRWHLQFDFDTAAWQRLVDYRLRRTFTAGCRVKERRCLLRNCTSRVIAATRGTGRTTRGWR
jgi:hypothetical protein